jgi:hypothetical protein
MSLPCRVGSKGFFLPGSGFSPCKGMRKQKKPHPPEAGVASLVLSFT